MITPNEIKKSQAKKLLKLIEENTRAEIMARFGRFDNLEYADYFLVKIEKMDEIREFIFGTSNLAELGMRWELIGEKKRKKKRKKKRSLKC